MRSMCGSSVMHSVLKDISRRELAKLGAATAAGLAMGFAPSCAEAETSSSRRMGASRETKVRLGSPVRLTAANIVDLTHTLNKSFPIIPVPGITFPFAQEPIASLEKNGVFANKWTMFDHMGTHIDATNHFDPDGFPLEEIPIASLVVPLVVVDIRPRASKDNDATLLVEDLHNWETRHGPIPRGAIVCMLSGWADKVGDPHGYLNMDASNTMHFPGIPVSTVDFLLRERDISGVGVDTISFDPGFDKAFSSHKALFKGGKWGVENIASLDAVPAAGAHLFIGATKIEGASGGPARLLALW
jgi:kynurenine formamidase